MVTGAMAVLRIAALFLTPLQLYPDEAQYWLWSRDLAAGYVSKPPVIAWLIAASTALGGDSEAWIRLPAVLCHAGAALVLYRVGRRLYGPAVGLLASLLWTLAPGILVSAAFIATDAPLALFLSLGLWGYAVLLTRAAGEGDRGAVEGASRCTDQTPAATAQSRPLHHPSGGPPPPYASLRVRSWPLAAALGASLGLAFLSKQAAIYFLGGLILHALTSREARAAWRGWAWAVTLAVFALVISPNIAWQATHHFATVAHTTEVNGHFGSSGLKPLDMLGFVAGQFGVLGPVPFGALLVGLVIYARR
ncbi:MAG: ArnT family glycosyltransferase, partial [Caulobacteraceae bacterium]